MKKISLLSIVFIVSIVSAFAQKTITFKSGKKILVIENSAEDYIVAFLQNPNSIQDTTGVANWFDLVQTKFELAKTTLAKESLVQLNNIAIILKEFPKLKIKIGCYSDALGNEASNIKLTQARAVSYKKYLLQYGVQKTKITSAKGYGSKFAKYSANADEEDRVKDRKIAIQIVAF